MEKESSYKTRPQTGHQTLKKEGKNWTTSNHSSTKALSQMCKTMSNPFQSGNKPKHKKMQNRIWLTNYSYKISINRLKE